MNTATLPAGVRPSRYSPLEFAAFKSENGRTYPLPFAEPPATLEAAVEAAKVRCFHKQTLVIREADGERSTLHVFAIRKAAPKWVHPAGEIMPRRVEDLYADLVAVLDGSMLA